MTKIEPRELRNAFGKFATGITVITSESNNKIHGMTANSFTSVSLDPAMLLVCVDNKSKCLSEVRETGQFAVSILAHDQRSISNNFANIETDEGIQFDRVEGMPVVAGAVAQFACDVDASHEAGDHSILIGRIRGLQTSGDDPLLFYSGGYRHLHDELIPIKD